MGTSIGAVISFIGLILLIGNIYGWWPSFPYAGFLTIGLGGLVMKITNDE